VLTSISRRATTRPARTLLPRRLMITGLAAGCIAYGIHRLQTHYALAVAAAVRSARQDRLTGLPTRPVMDDLLCAATRDRVPVTVALADIDGLHAVNAALGHAGGDQYIAEVARRLARALPAGGTLVRQGGDEFTLLVPGAVTAAQLATMIESALAEPAVVGGQHLQPRVSVGVHTSTGDAWHTLACADAAMYTAKENGGNHVLTYDADRDGIPEADGTRPATRRRDRNPTHHPAIPGTPAPVDIADGAADLSTLTPDSNQRRIRLSWSVRESFDAAFTEGDLTGLTQLAPLLGPDGRLDLDALPALDLGSELDSLLAEHETSQTTNGVQERQIEDADHLNPHPATETA
jgi:diguanylate cyclase (GGDEF)-like protein